MTKRLPYWLRSHRIPDDLEQRAPHEQVVWFQQDDSTRRMTHDQWNRYYVTTTAHRGMCCESCVHDEEIGLGYGLDVCCCRVLSGADDQPREGRNDGR